MLVIVQQVEIYGLIKLSLRLLDYRKMERKEREKGREEIKRNFIKTTTKRLKSGECVSSILQ